ncbi:sigma-54-dependent transcriptional regulator [Pseudomonas aeruginosa]
MWRETKLLLIDDNLDRSRDLAVILNFLGEDQLTCNSEDWREVAAGLSNSREALCVLLGSVESKGGAVELLKQLASWDEYLPILLIGEPAPADWPEELRRRVLASLEMPPSYNKLLDSLHRAQVYREMYDQARERGRSREPNLFRSLVGTSRAIQQVRQMMQQVADTDASVLILGESGTGKEVVARNLHYHSKRREGPFVPVNCGAIPAELLESELFGHEKGAFTGAITSRAGRFELANGGTLFLDEIGDLPMPIQVKLLRVLQEREVVRLGSRKSIPIDVRVLAATNVQLERAINAGHFREDLYYRLNVVSLELSPLRERPGDILPLTRHFIAEYSRRLGYGQSQLSPEAAQKLRAYSWPGNIRELENVIHHTLLICRDGLIRADDLHLSNLRLERGEELARGGPASGAAEHLLQQAFQRLFEEQGENLHGRVEDALLRAAYRFCHGNQVHTANLLGLSRNVTRTRLIAIGELVVNKRGGQRIDGERAVRLSI